MNDRVEELFARAIQARREGRAGEAGMLLAEVLQIKPDHAGALNSFGLQALAQGHVELAVQSLSRAVGAEPNAPALWLNLAEAHRAAGDAEAEIRSLDGALAIDPYLLPALLAKAQALERIGRLAESAGVYKSLLAASPNDSELPPQIRQALDHGRDVVHAFAERRARVMEEPLQQIYASHPEADFMRVRTYADHIAGRRKIYQQQPIGGHFPFLPAMEFFDRSHFPWFERLERETVVVREELLALWAEGDREFSPYVAFDPTMPVNQWAELNNSRRWSAWFFWKDGVRLEENCARCPATARILEDLPLLDIPNKGPVAMFSILEPKTRIPPHTGSSNVRATIHLPLVIPEGCGFRVGGETREWRDGEAWGFDDTIEHEAWNESDEPRAILIVDAWNPLLTEAERAAVRVLG